MATVTIDDTNLTNIANAIRNKNGSSTKYKPSEMASAISNIETGGVEPTGTLDITENGTYDVTDYASANVNVSTGGGGGNVEKGITINNYDSNGYPTDVSIVGMTVIPDYFLHGTGSAFSSGGKTFYGLFSKVTNWSLPDDLNEIKQYAFYNSGLSLTKLPESVSRIGKYAFYGCTNLALTKLPDKYPFYADSNLEEYMFYNCKKITIKEVSANARYIGQYAFYGCENLTELTFLGSNLYFNRSIFWNCYRLTKLVLPNVTSVPSLANKDVFTNTPFNGYTGYTNGELGYIYVPDTLVDSFKTANNWSNFADKIKGISELGVA